MHDNGGPLRLCGEVVPERGHICAFFDSDEEKYATLAPFFTGALEAGDRVVNVVEQSARAPHLTALRDRGVPVDHALASGRLTVDSAEDMYMRDGELQLDAVLDMVRDAIADASREHSCIRTCGEMNWIGRSPETLRQALEYEAKVNYLLPGGACTLLCVYRTADLPSGVVSDILATHEYAIINGRLRRNPYFVTPDDFLAMLHSRTLLAPQGHGNVPPRPA
jgi:hypothetical protein